MLYEWHAEDGVHQLALVEVPGTTADGPFLFGGGADRRPADVDDFHIATTPVTQALWEHVLGANPSVRGESRAPVENVSWDHIREPGGFLARINAGPVLKSLVSRESGVRFRLPSEVEWEYAARGGPHWHDEFAFSGSNNPNAVAWYGRRWRRLDDLAAGVLGWGLVNLVHPKWPTRTHAVALKRPNQLGIHDMSGNVWEWCEDACGDGTERRLRGGCHDNWDLHCRVWWRYGIAKDAHDGCIGFRLVLA